ncbi:DUF6171 family protein [Paenibacillus phoenicis]|uniref:DUF6171 family protein n=1 Tax=Paenibacillus phoenicis TaxID=554117 RepID=A0ABU5PFQ4_9BACL|nr:MULTISPECIES: DUF6171 family protein [Paenibacillus]MCT2193860.1 DUF6171 family protein [Paenibacillus sp. p3-SID1389]MEA3568592.1 DUF6171 family protein [Paenibacillus phoenicis]
MADTSCRVCRDDFRVTEEQIQRLLKTTAFAPERRVSEEQYQDRLRVCEACPKLMDGMTCTVCGCIIPVVAWLKERHCPLPGGGLWASIEA